MFFYDKEHEGKNGQEETFVQGVYKYATILPRPYLFPLNITSSILFYHIVPFAFFSRFIQLQITTNSTSNGAISSALYIDPVHDPLFGS